MRLRQIPPMCLCVCGAGVLSFSTMRNHASSAPAAPSSSLSSSSVLPRLRGGAAAAAAAGSGAASALWGRELPFLYGTAWKKEQTTDLVVSAVRAGFRGVDTACQPKHYREELVGAALARLAAEDGIARDALWLQTKFTPLPGQDLQTVPYDKAAKPADQARAQVLLVPTSSRPIDVGPHLIAPNRRFWSPPHRAPSTLPPHRTPSALLVPPHRAPLALAAITHRAPSALIATSYPHHHRDDHRRRLRRQARQSIARSLENLRTDRIDSLVLHSPLPSLAATLDVWRVFEEAADAGTVAQLGISNCYDAAFFASLYDAARVKPKVLQNRFYEKSGYDKELRAFCAAHDVTYQTFWTLTANPRVLKSDAVRGAVARLGVTPAQVLFAWLISSGHQPLTGTTSSAHMTEDLAAPTLVLTPAEMEAIGALFE